MIVLCQGKEYCNDREIGGKRMECNINRLKRSIQQICYKI